MKKARFGKVLFTLIISSAMLLALSIKEYAANSMADQLIVTTNKDVTRVLGAEAGIYQTALNAWMDTNKTLDASIANSRTYYGAGETLKVRFSFSREISSCNGLELGIKFGDGTERKISGNAKGSYVEFSYNIVAEDNGKLSLTYVKGTVQDDTGDTVALGKLEDSQTWKNTIIAKGSWNTNGVAAGQIQFEITMGDSTSGSSAYVLEGNTIRPMQKSDVYKLDTKTGKSIQYSNDTSEITFDEFSDNGKGIKRLTYPENTIIYIPNACDIAGNKRSISNAKGKHDVYIVNSQEEETSGKLKESTYYYKEGKKIHIIIAGDCTSVITNPTEYIKIGAQASNASGWFKENGKIAEDLYKYTYTIQNNDNGQIKIACGNAIQHTNEHVYIADTTAPVITWERMGVVEKNTNKIGWVSSGSYIQMDGATAPQDSGTYYGYSSSVTKTENNPARLYLKDGKPRFGFSISDANIDEEDCVQETQNDGQLKGNYEIKKNSIEYKEPLSTLQKKGSYIISHKIKATDLAGNEVESSSWWDGKLEMIADWEGPEITITNTNETNQDQINFTIKATDPTVTGAPAVAGSGVEGAIDATNIVVQNGTIISSTKDNSTHTTNITVMPAVDGYVSIHVPSGAVKDNCDNPNTASNITKVYVDRTAPIIHDITGVPTDWTDEATLSVIASDAGVGEMKYMFLSQEIIDKEAAEAKTPLGSVEGPNPNVFMKETKLWQDSNIYKVSKNGKYGIAVRDSVGNYTYKVIEITKIDNTAPTISVVDYHKGWTNQDVEVTINASDADSGIKEYSFDGGTTWQALPKKTYTTSATINANQIKVRDYVGKETTYSGSAINVQIDKTAPKITNVQINPDKETEGNVTLTVTASDKGGSELATNCYSFNGGEYVSSNTYVASENGDVTIKVRDNAGNETSIVKTINNIKKFEPVITIENNGGTYVRPTDGGATKLKPIVKVEGATDVSISYVLSTSSTKPTAGYSSIVKSNRVELDVSVNGEGTYYLWVAVTNSANSKTIYAKSDPFYIKNSEITFNMNPELNQGWAKEDVTVNVAYGEGLTKNKLISVNNVATGTTTGVTVSETGTVYAEATDIAGNKVSKTLDVKIDKTAPVVTIEKMEASYSLNANGEVNMDNRITVQEDNLEKVQYAWTKEKKAPTTWENFTAEQISAKVADVTRTAKSEDIGTWYLYVKATDLVGNVTIANTEKLIVKSAITIDTSKGSCVEKVTQIDGTGYIIVQPGTTATKLLKYVKTEGNAKLEIKTAETQGKSVEGNTSLATNEVITLDDIYTKYMIVVKGDIKADGNIEYNDVLRLNSYTLGHIDLTQAEKLAADVKPDGNIEYNDVLKLNSYTLGQINKL